MKSKSQMKTNLLTNEKPMYSYEKGIILIGALALLAILELVATIAFNTTNMDIKISSNYKNGVQAFYIAEAGIEHASATLGSNFDTLLTDPPSGIAATSFGDGIYTVFATDNGDDGDQFSDIDNIILLTSYGSSDAGSQKVIEVRVTQNTITDYAVYSGGELEIKEDVTVNGDIYSVLKLETKDDSTVNGNVSTSSNDLTTDGTVTGTEDPNAPFQATPTLDFDSYKALAQSGSGPPGWTYINGDYTLENSTLTDTIIYVTGRVELDNVNFVNSSIIADGNIQVEGINSGTNDFTTCITCAAGGPYPLFATKDELEIKGDSSGGGCGDGTINLTGLIYADGKLEIKGPGVINIDGAIVSASTEEGDLELKDACSGALTVTYNPGNLPTLGSLRILSWREVY